MTLRQTELLHFLKADPRNFVFYKPTGSFADRPFMCYVVVHREDGGQSVVTVDYRTADSLENKKLIKKEKLKKIVEVFDDRFRYGSIYVDTVWKVTNGKKN